MHPTLAVKPNKQPLSVARSVPSARTTVRGEDSLDPRQGLPIFLQAKLAGGSGSRGAVNPVALRTSQPIVQRQPKTTTKATPTAADIADFEAMRGRFEREQEEHFEHTGALMRASILQAAGLPRGHEPATPDEALAVVKMWGVTIATLTGQLPQLKQSLSGQLGGSHASATLAQQQQALVAALTTAGQQAFKDVLARVRREPFWDQHFKTFDIFILPDLSGTNVYAGYTQRASGQTAGGITMPAFIIHISKDRLNAGQVDESTATLVHELGHTLYSPSVIDRSLKSFRGHLAGLLADHPQIGALRTGAPDPDEARQIHVRHISQMLYERTGYAEAEIFSHLQQLTHQPPVQISGQQVSASHFILATVENFVKQLKRIGLPPRMLANILGSLGSRVAWLYDRRIAAAPKGSDQRRLLVLNKEQALSILGIASDS